MDRGAEYELSDGSTFGLWLAMIHDTDRNLVTLHKRKSA